VYRHRGQIRTPWLSQAWSETPYPNNGNATVVNQHCNRTKWNKAYMKINRVSSRKPSRRLFDSIIGMTIEDVEVSNSLLTEWGTSHGAMESSKHISWKSPSWPEITYFHISPAEINLVNNQCRIRQAYRLSLINLSQVNSEVGNWRPAL
jgi:hypothetical protein